MIELRLHVYAAVVKVDKTEQAPTGALCRPQLTNLALLDLMRVIAQVRALVFDYRNAAIG